MDSPRSRNDTNRWGRSFTFSHIWGNKDSLWWRRFAACSNTDSGTAWQQYRGGSRPNTEKTAVKGLYGCVIEEYALKASKLVTLLLYLILTFLAVSPLLNRCADNHFHQRSASLYTTNTRSSVCLQLWALCKGAHRLSGGQRCTFSICSVFFKTTLASQTAYLIWKRY